MVAKSGKDKKLVLVPSYIVTALMEIANRKGKPFYSFVAETLEQALDVYNGGQTLKDVVNSYEFFEAFKSSGARIVSDDLFNFLIDKSYHADENSLQDKMYMFGRRCGKTLASKYIDPVAQLKDFLATAGWNLNYITVSREKAGIKIRCASPIISMENTMLLLKFIDGVMNELGHVSQKQDSAKGILSLEYGKT
jgi:hypothetical protein